MRICHTGHSIANVFPIDTNLIGRHLEDVFRLIRPDILLEWNKVCFTLTLNNAFEPDLLQVLSYGRHIVFVIESRIPLRPNPFVLASKAASQPVNGEIRLKGQMKLIAAWNMIVFLCHPVFVFLPR